MSNIELPNQTISLNEKYIISVNSTQREGLKSLEINEKFNAKEQLKRSLVFGLPWGLGMIVFSKKQSNNRLQSDGDTAASEA